MSTVKLPRVNLGNWPTPLHELPHLAAALGGPRIFVKRDDLTGLALGGNKCRKLEYVLGDAKQRGIDSIITTGSSQSNFALQMAAAARYDRDGSLSSINQGCSCRDARQSPASQYPEFDD